MSAEIKSECEEFISNFKSLLLATKNKDGDPEISYAPYTDNGESFFIMTSQLSSHTENLIFNPEAKVMFIEDEISCPQIYARKRLIIKCRVTHFSHGSDAWRILIPNFFNKFGEIINTLSSLPDFELFKLDSIDGNWVKGFGKAYYFKGRIARDSSHIIPK